jgi:plastocyanin
MRARIATAATGLLAAAVLSACGGSSDDGTAASTSVASSADDGQAATGGTVEVEAKDYTLELSTTTFSPGEYTFTMRNDGGATHAIEIDGPGVEDQKSDAVGPGGTASVTVTLQAGDYTIYCPVGSHRAMGMQTTFTVG